MLNYGSQLMRVWRLKMITNILLLSIIALIIKVTDFVPLKIIIGDLHIQNKLSSLIIVTSLFLIIFTYLSNISRNIKNIISSYLLRQKIKNEKIYNEHIIIECAKKICGKNQKLKIKKNILHNVISFIYNNDSIENAKKLDKFINKSIFTNIFFAKEHINKKQYIKAQTNLEYLNNNLSDCSWTINQLYTCYIKNNEFDNCNKFLNSIKSTIDNEEFIIKKSNLMFAKYQFSQNDEDIELALSINPYSKDILNSYLQVFQEDIVKITTAIEKYWSQTPSLEFGFTYYNSLTLLQTHKLDKINNLTKDFPDHINSLILKCYASINASVNSVEELLYKIKQYDLYMYNALKLYLIAKSECKEDIVNISNNLIISRKNS